MSNELGLFREASSGDDLYCRLRNGTNQIYSSDVPGMEALADANVAYYRIDFTETASTGDFVGSMPGSLAAGVYRYEVFARAGANAAWTDDKVGDGGRIDWDGTAEVNLDGIKSVTDNLPDSGALSTIQADLDNPAQYKATGFAVSGDPMTLEADAIKAVSYDESTAFPIKSEDADSTQIARVGADGDTLETLSDEIATAQADLDNPSQYQADVSALATSEALATAQADLDDPAQYKADVSALATAIALEAVQTDLDSPDQYKANVAALATSEALGTAQADLDTITGSDGVTLATTQGNYAPAKAGDAMTLAAAAITAAVIDTDAIDADALATDALTEIQASVKAALEAMHLDHLLAVTYDPASKPGVADALLNELVENDGGVARYTENALEQAPTAEMDEDELHTALDSYEASGGTIKDIVDDTNELQGDDVPGLIAALNDLSDDDVWGHDPRTLTQSAASVESAVSGDEITVYRGTTWIIPLTGLGDISSRTELYFSVKYSLGDVDDDAVLRVSEDGGLERINKAAPTAAGNGSLVVDDEVAGDITITVKAVEAAKAPVISGLSYDIKEIQAGDVANLVSSGEEQFDIAGDVTRAVS